MTARRPSSFSKRSACGSAAAIVSSDGADSGRAAEAKVLEKFAEDRTTQYQQVLARERGEKAKLTADQAQTELDKAAKNGRIHRNKANRHKRQLAKRRAAPAKAQAA